MNKKGCNQISGKPWTFRNKGTGEAETVILPSVGESNATLIWHPVLTHSRGGYWIHRRFHYDNEKWVRSGQSPTGLLGTMTNIFYKQKNEAKKKGYKPPDTTPEKMLETWVAQDGKCIACLSPLNLFSLSLNAATNACYDHNHETGEPRGFIHNRCNIVEGRLLKMSDEEFENYITWVSKIHGRRNNVETNC
jgi:hypothetical protein